MSYHHFASESLASVTQILSYFLRDGGHLFVADVQSTEDHADIFGDGLCPSGVVTQKRGFTQQQMSNLFAGAGLRSFKFDRVTRAKKNGRNVDIFLARGLKSAPQINEPDHSE